jgi:hypothetical protein
METKPINRKAVPSVKADAPNVPETAASPLKVFRSDDVSASVFARERDLGGQRVTFYSVSFSRSYKDATGQRQYSKSFDTEDLGKVMQLAQQAREFIQSLAYPAAEA